MQTVKPSSPKASRSRRDAASTLASRVRRPTTFAAPSSSAACTAICPTAPRRAEHEHAIVRRRPSPSTRPAPSRRRRRCPPQRQPQGRRRPGRRSSSSVGQRRRAPRGSPAARCRGPRRRGRRARRRRSRADGLAAGRVRKRRMPAVEHAVPDGDVERVERHRLDRDPPGGPSTSTTAGRRLQLADLGCCARRDDNASGATQQLERHARCRLVECLLGQEAARWTKPPRAPGRSCSRRRIST